MHREGIRLLQARLFLSDVAALTVGLLASYRVRGWLLAADFGGIYPLRRYLWVYFTAVVSVPFIFKYLRLYDIDDVVAGHRSFRRELGRMCLGMGLAYAVLSVVAYSLRLFYVSRLLTLSFVSLSLVLAAVSRALLRPVLRRKAEAEPLSVVIVGSGPEALRLAAMVSERRIGTRLLGLVS